MRNPNAGGIRTLDLRVSLLDFSVLRST